MSEVRSQGIPAAGAPHNAVAPLPSLQAVLWIAWFSLREMSRRRRLISLAAINLLPVAVVLIIRLWYPEQAGTAQLQLSILTNSVFIPFLIPVVAIFVGVSAIGEQIEDGTIVYAWTRPVRRRAIFLGRLLAAQWVSSLLLAGALVLCFLIMVSGGPDIITWDFLKLYFQTFLVIFLGVFAYAALFATMGTFFKKPVLPAILFAFIWEGLSDVPARVQELTLRFHLQNLVPRPEAAPEDLTGFLESLLTVAVQRNPVPPLQSVTVLLGVMVVATVVGIWLLRHKEIEK